jgi:hypothetical protein
VAAGAAAAAAGLSVSRDKMSSSLSTMYFAPVGVSMLSPAYLKYNTWVDWKGGGSTGGQTYEEAGKGDTETNGCNHDSRQLGQQDMYSSLLR